MDPRPTSTLDFHPPHQVGRLRSTRAGHARFGRKSWSVTSLGSPSTTSRSATWAATGGAAGLARRLDRAGRLPRTRHAQSSGVATDLSRPARPRGDRGASWITTNDEVLEIVLQVLDRLIPRERFVVAGHSAGGYLARAVLHRRMALVDGLLQVVPEFPDDDDEELPEPGPLVSDPDLLERVRLSWVQIWRRFPDTARRPDPPDLRTLQDAGAGVPRARRRVPRSASPHR